MAYLLDSDVFIQASNLHYQFSFCPAFWKWIDREHAAKKIFSIDKVLEEIKVGKFGDLTPWAIARPSLFLRSTEIKTMDSLKRLAVWVKTNYDEASYEKFFRGADFVLVGFAHANNHILVTQEIRGGKSRIKIPDACDALDVKCINTWDMLKAENAKFILT